MKVRFFMLFLAYTLITGLFWGFLDVVFYGAVNSDATQVMIVGFALAINHAMERKRDD